MRCAWVIALKPENRVGTTCDGEASWLVDNGRDRMPLCSRHKRRAERIAERVPVAVTFTRLDEARRTS